MRTIDRVVVVDGVRVRLSAFDSDVLFFVQSRVARSLCSVTRRTFSEGQTGRPSCSHNNKTSNSLLSTLGRFCLWYIGTSKHGMVAQRVFSSDLRKSKQALVDNYFSEYGSSEATSKEEHGQGKGGDEDCSEPKESADDDD